MWRHEKQLFFDVLPKKCIFGFGEEIVALCGGVKNSFFFLDFFTKKLHFL